MTITINITHALIEWVAEQLSYDTDEAETFTQEFVGMLYFTGGFAAYEIGSGNSAYAELTAEIEQAAELERRRKKVEGI